ncbi:Protein of unknown function [Gryllus bimaculatus]|nr:Protein of unknown function [Gryllus bimaculatus]
MNVHFLHHILQKETGLMWLDNLKQSSPVCATNNTLKMELRNVRSILFLLCSLEIFILIYDNNLFSNVLKSRLFTFHHSQNLECTSILL